MPTHSYDGRKDFGCSPAARRRRDISSSRADRRGPGPSFQAVTTAYYYPVGASVGQRRPAEDAAGKERAEVTREEDWEDAHAR